jgi:AcrR family transcriptional regulator
MSATIEQLRRAPARPRGQDTVERLLASADRLLAREGAAALATTRVAEEAGMSVGTVYNWFPDKESIAEALALRYWRELADLLAEVAEAAESVALEDPVGAGLDALAAGFRARPGFLSLWFGGLRTERLRDVTRSYRDEVSAGVERSLAAAYPEAAPELLRAAARMVVLLGDGILREAFRLDRDGDVTVLAEGTHALHAYISTRLGEAP